MDPTGTFQIDGQLTGKMGNTMVAALAGGGFVIVWDHYGEYELGYPLSAQYRTYDTSGSPTSDVQALPTTNGLNQHFTDIVALSNGGFALGWYRDPNALGGKRFPAILCKSLIPLVQLSSTLTEL